MIFSLFQPRHQRATLEACADDTLLDLQDAALAQMQFARDRYGRPGCERTGLYIQAASELRTLRRVLNART